MFLQRSQFRRKLRARAVVVRASGSSAGAGGNSLQIGALAEVVGVESTVGLGAGGRSLGKAIAVKLRRTAPLMGVRTNEFTGLLCWHTNLKLHRARSMMGSGNGAGAGAGARLLSNAVVKLSRKVHRFFDRVEFRRSAVLDRFDANVHRQRCVLRRGKNSWDAAAAACCCASEVFGA